MCNFFTKVNKLKIRFLYFLKKPYFSPSNLSRETNRGKSNLIPLLIMEKMPSYLILVTFELTNCK